MRKEFRNLPFVEDCVLFEPSLQSPDILLCLLLCRSVVIDLYVQKLLVFSNILD